MHVALPVHSNHTAPVAVREALYSPEHRAPPVCDLDTSITPSTNASGEQAAVQLPSVHRPACTLRCPLAGELPGAAGMRPFPRPGAVLQAQRHGGP